MNLENTSLDKREALTKEVEATQPIKIDADLDFDAHSIFKIACLIEAEQAQISENEAISKLLLQKIVLKSKLSGFKSADKSKLSALLDHVYQEQGYQGDWKAFFNVENTQMSQVLHRRKGIPMTLGIVLLEFLESTGFNAQGICFPSGFIIQVNCENEVIYIDPFIGEFQTWEQLEVKVRGHLGNHAKLTLDMLNVDTHKVVIKRLLNIMKAAYLQASSFELALLCSDILLRIDPQDIFERRDRGFLFQQLDCVNLAVHDFEFFIKKFPEDPMVSTLKKQIIEMNFNKPVIH